MTWAWLDRAWAYVGGFQLYGIVIPSVAHMVIFSHLDDTYVRPLFPGTLHSSSGRE